MPQPDLTDPADHDARSRQGLLFGVAAYGLWGLIPIYFKAVIHVGAWELVAQRVLWSCVLLSAIVALMGRTGELVQLLRRPAVMRRLLISTTLIALNWLTYIYAVYSHQVMQASLGYFVTPLANVLLGCLVLKERLRPLQALGLAVAAGGVVIMLALGSGVPWVALSIAVTFALYALARKTLAVDGLLALAVETLLLLPAAAGFILYDHLWAAGALGRFGLSTDLLLAASGPVTAIPLLCFGAAARRLKLTTLGFLQYLAPSVQLLLAVLLFGEPFRLVQLVSFVSAWIASAFYTADSLLILRERRSQAALLAAAAATVEPT